MTPLYMAALYGCLNVVTDRYLTQEQQCDPACADKNNDTLLHVAASVDQLQVVKFFVETLHCSLNIKGQVTNGIST